MSDEVEVCLIDVVRGGNYVQQSCQKLEEEGLRNACLVDEHKHFVRMDPDEQLDFGLYTCHCIELQPLRCLSWQLREGRHWRSRICLGQRI